MLRTIRYGQEDLQGLNRIETTKYSGQDGSKGPNRILRTIYYGQEDLQGLNYIGTIKYSGQDGLRGLNHKEAPPIGQGYLAPPIGQRYLVRSYKLNPLKYEGIGGLQGLIRLGRDIPTAIQKVQNFQYYITRPIGRYITRQLFRQISPIQQQLSYSEYSRRTYLYYISKGLLGIEVKLIG